MSDYLGEAIADSSYDDIRRKDLILPVEAGVFLKAAAQADAKTNDGMRAYAISPECAAVMRLYKMAGWNDALTKLMANRKSLIERLARKRSLARVPLKIGDQTFSLSAGAHDVVQKAVVEHFLPLFGSGAEVLYLGDTEKKNLFHLHTELKKLGFFELAHDKLPDIVAYNKRENWLFLIEAVDTSNPITEFRKASLKKSPQNVKLTLCTSPRSRIVQLSANLRRTSHGKQKSGLRTILST